MFFLMANPAHADIRPVPVMELGYHFHTGKEAGPSLTGAKGYSLVFISEDTKDNFRPHAGAEFDFSSGNMFINSEEYTYSLYGANFVPGVSFYIFSEGYFQPFISGSGIIGWHYASLSDPPGDVEKQTQGLSFGYELSAGIDIRGKQSDATAFRLKGSVVTLSSTITGKTTDMGAFKFSVGIVF